MFENIKEAPRGAFLLPAWLSFSLRSHLSTFEETKTNMITCSTLGKNGRLGNQLFQIAAVIGLAKLSGHTYGFPEWAYQDAFVKPLPSAPEDYYKMTKEKNLDYYPIDVQSDTNYDLYGYFQSEKYFSEAQDLVKEYLTFNEDRFKRLREIKPGTIAVHVRRGDYVGNPNYAQLPLSYYLESIEYLQSKGLENVLIFSDDIEWCEEQFPGTFNFSDGRTEIEDLYLISKCEAVVMSNSSFSWWGAWLNGTEHVIAPNIWFDGPLKNHSTGNDLIPSRWTLFSNIKLPKLDLTDLTFTIPVMWDHTDREENLKLLLEYLTRRYETNIFVTEQGLVPKFKELCKNFPGVVYRLHKTESKEFERTKLLNEMAADAVTPYIANWDADVFISYEQIQACLDQLKSNQADMCYPYNGLFHRMKRDTLYSFQAFMTTKVWDSIPKRSVEYSQTSYGGAVLFNRESFIKGGMENQYMVSYGPEDYERYERFTKLGYKVTRVFGPLYHLDHFIGENSNATHKYFKHNEHIFAQVKQLDAEGLRTWISQWPWIKDVDVYGDKFFTDINDGARVAAAKILPHLIKPLGIVTVIDVGCGQGAWLSVAKELGCKVIGVDGKYVNKGSLLIDQSEFMTIDLTRHFKAAERYDLALCLEVAEHLPESRADSLIDDLCKLADHVLFSAAIPGQGGRNHINEQWQSYWAGKFNKRGYSTTDIRGLFWNEVEIPYWYKQNMFLYKKESSEPIYPSSNKMLDIIHPEKFRQVVESNW